MNIKSKIKESIRQFFLGPSSEKQILNIAKKVQRAVLDGRRRTYVIFPAHLRNETKEWLEKNQIKYYIIDANREIPFPIENRKKGFLWIFEWNDDKRLLTQ